MKYVDLVIDNKSDNTDTFYTYGCADDSILPGQKVWVPFARGNRLREAYVFDVREDPGREVSGLKYVEKIDREIQLTPEILETCKWMKRRLACRFIDAVKLFAPSGEASRRGKKRVPYKDHEGETQPIEQLTKAQESVLMTLGEPPGKAGAGLFLLHGVTGSGKTEVYMRAIAQCLHEGRTAIMMVPEIALTKQIIDRFAGRFGSDSIAVLHSRLSSGARYDEWMRIRNGEAPIVIGARSAVFAPLANIGLIILDEEHEPTYKSDMTPKYDALEIAVKRAKEWSARVIIGSATPSVVSYYRSITGIFRLLEMPERYNQMPLPKVQVVDMRQELREGNRSIISRALCDALAETLDQGKQAILFHNRRGYNTFFSCRACGHVERCPKCGISLTYHKDEDKMLCHYCGLRREKAAACPACGSKAIKLFGTGTEKVDDAIKQLFPEAATSRLDLDAVRKKGSLEEILDRFARGEIQVLTGTQLVAKGLDFRNVGLVGVISADALLQFPDFRSPERAFQLMTQAAGRAGRGDHPGAVIIQTYTPGHYAVLAAAEQDYARFYGMEIKYRKAMEYPPFSDLIQVVAEGPDDGAACAFASEVCRILETSLPPELSGRIFPPQPERDGGGKDFSYYSIIIKSPPGKRTTYMDVLEKARRGLTGGRFKGCRISVDVNPYNIWRN